MTLKNNRAPLLFYFKLCASFRSHWCIKTWVRVRKRPIWVKFDDVYSRVTLKFDGWPWITTGHLFYATSSFVVHNFVAIGEFKLGVTVRKRPICVKFDNFLEPCALEIWRMTLKNNRAPLLCNIKLYASFRHHMWIQTGVAVRKRFTWVVTSVTLTFDIWPWPFAWSFLLVIDNNSWKFHDDTMIGTQSKRCDRRTDRQTNGQTDRRKIPFVELLGGSLKLKCSMN